MMAAHFSESVAKDAACARLAVHSDELLPKLISGELRVGDAERFVSEALS